MEMVYNLQSTVFQKSVAWLHGPIFKESLRMARLESLLREGDPSLTVSRETLANEARERLRALILNNELPPGTHLVEASLGKLLGVSRGPIREALRALDREGLVVISPHKGAVVVEWSLQDLLDAYDVRAILEIRAMELAAERSGESCAEELAALLDSWEEAGRAGDRERCADLDLEFHRIIWRHSLNRSLVSTLEQTIHPLQTVFYLNSTRYDDLIEVVALHRQMKDAVATQQVSDARAAMEAHMKHSLKKARRHPKQNGG
jgi:DNA-binding GntR family transcriptional regulator